MAWKFYAPDSFAQSGWIGTALPSSASDGQLFVLTDSVTVPTWQWQLRYVAAKSSNKWVFLGGPDMVSSVSASETTTSTSYTALTTAGPSLTVPVAGDYDVQVEFNCFIDNNSAGGFMSFDVGATTALDDDALIGGTRGTAGAGNEWGAGGAKTSRKTSIAGSTTITAKYRADFGTMQFRNRVLRIRPVALGG